jgi:FkbM family methyltransferase
MPRFVPGERQFGFGLVRFMDGWSFASQFEDIFMRQVYDFVSDSPPRILDCGGNVGLSVIRFKQRFPQSRITVFEADPSIAEVLEKNLRTLGLDDVEIVKAAAWTAAGMVGFARDGGDGGRLSNDSRHEVPAVRLADWITEPVDMLKVDIEGAEFELLADLCATGKILQVRRIICELHKRDDVDFDQVCSLMAALSHHGFRVCVSHGRSAPCLGGGARQPTPFPAIEDGKFLLEVYAWKD